MKTIDNGKPFSDKAHVTGCKKWAAAIDRNMANIFYIIGSLCFLIGTLINMFKK